MDKTELLEECRADRLHAYGRQVEPADRGSVKRVTRRHHEEVSALSILDESYGFGWCRDGDGLPWSCIAIRQESVAAGSSRHSYPYWVDIRFKHAEVYARRGKIDAEVGQAGLGSTAADHEAIRRGRPPKYDWSAFYAEVVRIISNDGLPGPDGGEGWSSQADLERRMATWCQERWGQEPAGSLIRDRLSKLLAATRNDR
jgi:hypothetical protein